jgi:site-specific DNA recombinase
VGTTILPAVLYGRKSTDRQEASVREQLEWGRRTADLRAVQLAAQFTDEGVSGSEIARRDGLQQLIRFIESRTATDPVRVIVCWSIDRLSRSDTLETFEVLSRVRRAGVRTIITNSKDYDLHNMTDRTLLAVEQDFTNSGYVRKLSENTTRALVSRARDARWLGRVPYGYRIGTDGRLTPGDPERVEAVRWLYATYSATGASLKELARKLVERGAPPPTAAGWSRFAVYTILRNQAYTGLYRWNTQRTGRHYRVKECQVTEVRPDDAPPAVPGAKGRRRVRNVAADVIEVRDAHPAIIDAETFAAVAKRLERNRHRRTSPTRGRVWPLSGLARCQNCGGRMVGRIDRQRCNGKTYTYQVLYCSRAGVHGCDRCRTHRIAEERVILEAAALIQERLGNPELLAELQADFAALAREHVSEGEAELQRLRDRLAELDRRIDQGAENLLLCPQSVRDRAAAKLEQWQTERSRVAREILTLETAAENRDGTAVRAAELLEVAARFQESVELAMREGDRAKVRDCFAFFTESVRLEFKHGRELRNGSRRTYLAKLEVDLLDDVAQLLGTGIPTLWRR